MAKRVLYEKQHKKSILARVARFLFKVSIVLLVIVGLNVVFWKQVKPFYASGVMWLNKVNPELVENWGLDHFINGVDLTINDFQEGGIVQALMMEPGRVDKLVIPTSEIQRVREVVKRSSPTPSSHIGVPSYIPKNERVKFTYSGDLAFKIEDYNRLVGRFINFNELRNRFSHDQGKLQSIDFFEKNLPATIDFSWRAGMSAGVKLIHEDLETRHGLSRLAQVANNYGGRKAIPKDRDRLNEKVAELGYSPSRVDQVIDKSWFKLSSEAIDVIRAKDEDDWCWFEVYPDVRAWLIQRQKLLSNDRYGWIWRTFPVRNSDDMRRVYTFDYLISRSNMHPSWSYWETRLKNMKSSPRFSKYYGGQPKRPVEFVGSLDLNYNEAMYCGLQWSHYASDGRYARNLRAKDIDFAPAGYSFFSHAVDGLMLELMK